MECGGVTKEPQSGGVYTLRKARMLKDTPADRKGVYSYKRGPCETGVTWCPHRDMKLGGYTEGGKVAVASLEQAQAKCLKMGDGCGGVTKEKDSKNDLKYTLRKSTELKPSEEGKHISYTKGACTDDEEPTDPVPVPTTDEPVPTDAPVPTDEPTDAPISPCEGEPCGMNGQCFSVDGDDDYSCDCFSGYEYNGVTCEYVDPCEEPSPCGPNGACIADSDSYSCDCFTSFEFINGTCEFVDPCESNAQCGANGDCVAEDGRASCQCFSGFVEVDGVCVDHDECLDNPCAADKVCRNSEGGHSCDCQEGLVEVDGVCTIKTSGSATVTISNAAVFANSQKPGRKMGIHCVVKIEGITLENPKDPENVKFWHFRTGGWFEMLHQGDTAPIQKNYRLGQYRLYFQKTAPSDSGMYKCEFTHGTVKESAIVVVNVLTPSE